MDAYNYAKLFNEARENDGMSPFYREKDLEGYRNSSGVNDLLYPNVDYYKEFLRSQNTFRKATLELNGGNKKATYAVTVGYTGSAGLEKVGDRSDLNRINARGNLDIHITDFLSVAAGSLLEKMVPDYLVKFLLFVLTNILSLFLLVIFMAVMVLLRMRVL